MALLSVSSQPRLLTVFIQSEAFVVLGLLGE